MKYLILTLITLNLYASNFIPVSTIENKTKAGYSLLSDCQKASLPNDVCVDVGSNALDTYEVYTYEVDDEARPIHSKNDISKCGEYCKSLFPDHTCTDPNESKILNLDLKEIYCSKILAYNKKTLRSIRQANELVAEYNFKKSLSDSTELQEKKLQEKIKMIDNGKRIIALLNLRNESKNLSMAQVAQLITTFSSIKSVLETGSLLTAKGLIMQVTPDGTVITNDDKTALINEIDRLIAK